ncbi:MAG TPA: aminopeptidase [Anaerolineae bacterium]|nr:aminopeptidase [Anaerolineae bacterium]
MSAHALERICRKVVGECVGLKKGESCLLVRDFETTELHRALEAAIRSHGGIPIVASLPETAYVDGLLPTRLETAMKSGDVVLINTREIFPHGPRRSATETGARLLSMCMVSEGMALRALDVDYDQLSRVTRRAVDLLSRSSEILIRSDAGTEISMDISDRPVTYFDGLAREPGKSTGLPAGVVALAPVANTAEGRVILDGSIHHMGLLRKPVILTVKKGRIETIEGSDEAEALRSMLGAADENARCIAEVGLGTNPKATYTGNLVEDERVSGSGHIGFGRNTHIGGDIESALHTDATIRKPSIYLDGETIVKEGRLLVEP